MKERISLPLFCGFSLNEICGVLPSCVEEGESSRYDPISCRECVKLRFMAMYKTD